MVHPYQQLDVPTADVEIAKWPPSTCSAFGDCCPTPGATKPQRLRRQHQAAPTWPALYRQHLVAGQVQECPDAPADEVASLVRHRAAADHSSGRRSTTKHTGTPSRITAASWQPTAARPPKGRAGRLPVALKLTVLAAVAPRFDRRCVHSDCAKPRRKNLLAHTTQSSAKHS